MVKKKEMRGTSGNSVVNYFRDLGDLFFHPGKFLKGAVKKKDVWKVLGFFAIAYLIFLVLKVVIDLIYGGNIAQLILGALAQIVFMAVSLFVMLGIVHLSVKILRGKQGFVSTSKVVSYALTIWVVYSLIALIIFLVLPFETRMLEAVQGSQDMELIKTAYRNFFAQPGAIVNLIVGLISLIHVVIFSIGGLVKFQKFSRARAGLVIVLSVIFGVIVFFILGLLIALGGG